MEVDNTVSKILIDIGKKHGLESDKVFDIVDGMFSGVRKSITDKKVKCIKIDYFGKFLFSDAWKEQKRKHFGEPIEFEDLIFT